MVMARVLNLMLAGWLLLSAFLWSHSGAQFWNALLGGILVALFAWLATGKAPNARFANTLVGAWLMLSTFYLPSLRQATVWNHMMVGALVLVLSLVATSLGTAGPSRRRPPLVRGAA
jgi:hypothetical protein